MQTIKHIFKLALVSVILLSVEQMILEKAFSFEFLQEIKYVFVIVTMLVYLVLVYFILRRWNNNTRPAFLKTWATMFFIQLLTIISFSFLKAAPLLMGLNTDTAPMAIQLDVEDFMIKALLFAGILPLIILAVIYLFDRKI